MAKNDVDRFIENLDNVRGKYIIEYLKETNDLGFLMEKAGDGTIPFIKCVETKGLEDFCLKVMDLPGFDKVVARKDYRGRNGLHQAARYANEAVLLRALDYPNIVELAKITGDDTGLTFFDEIYVDMKSVYEKVLTLPNAHELLQVKGTNERSKSVFEHIASNYEDLLLKVWDMPKSAELFNNADFKKIGVGISTEEEICLKMLASPNIDDQQKHVILTYICKNHITDGVCEGLLLKIVDLPNFVELAKIKKEGHIHAELLNLIAYEKRDKVAEKIATSTCAFSLLTKQDDSNLAFCERYPKLFEKVKEEASTKPELAGTNLTKNNTTKTK